MNFEKMRRGFFSERGKLDNPEIVLRNSWQSGRISRFFKTHFCLPHEEKRFFRVHCLNTARLCFDTGEMSVVDGNDGGTTHRNGRSEDSKGNIPSSCMISGTVEVLSYPPFQLLHTLVAHTVGCYCIAIDPIGRYFAVGSADALVSLWDLSEILCVRTFTKLEWPVRTISFNHDGQYMAFASEDLFIDIVDVQTGRTIHQISFRAAMNSVEWNPKYNLLAFDGDDKNKYMQDEGVFRVFGFETP